MENWPTELGYRIDFFTIFSMLGIVQGFFLAGFFLLGKSAKVASNYYLGWMILTLTLITSEIFLCYSGVIVHVIHYVDATEPLNFVFAPLVYFFVRALAHKPIPKWYWHFLPFALYFLYSCFFFFQSEAFKFNAFRWAYHPNLPELNNVQTFHADPLGIKSYVNVLANLHFFLYLPFIISALSAFLQQQKPLTIWQLFRSKTFGWLLGFILLIFLSYGLWMYKVLFNYRDLGDNVGAAFNTFIIYFVNFFVLKNSIIVDIKHPMPKYQKSTLSDSLQEHILKKLKTAMQTEKVYKDPSINLKTIAEKINTSPHHLSQVLNKKLNKTYYEWIAEYRVEEAKVLLQKECYSHYKMEEIGKMAGFNSKSAFYKAFNRLEQQTPTAFQKGLNGKC